MLRRKKKIRQLTEDQENQARLLALGRLGFGVVGLVAPRLFVRSWIGREAKPYPTNMITRGFAARDIGLAVGTLAALEAGSPVRGWLEGAALSDAGDALGTLGSWRDLPGLRRWLLLGAEVGAAAVGMQLASSIDE